MLVLNAGEATLHPEPLHCLSQDRHSGPGWGGRQVSVAAAEGWVSGVLQRDPKQISAGLTRLSAELSPTAKAAQVAPAWAGSGYSPVRGALSPRCPGQGWQAVPGPVGRLAGLAGRFKRTQRV